MVNSTDFAKRLEKILDYYGLSATAFSEAIDFNRSTISHLLSGRNKPSLEFVMKVVQQFPEVELYWLLNGKGTFPVDAKEQIAPTPNIPNNKVSLEAKKNLENRSISENSKNQQDIERIVIFYKDGSFKTYEN
ncbi:helix-turn-helix protein [Ulvibacter sp. MAR_2010_11]|uniref:helix-turn-helix domain-containing protein n=1 Tax=Ulvibacter sp. MAR_2010_11 TaxID=1250229 RepID=UPI000C2CA6F3|nr:helix-turn-helix transcriptional regulator [Ulvibacter sp. MAR_2010_11]PKA84085.1 helix-turn-helix protein [Ulvibacter sp. MAR_2010_11]